MSEVLSLFLVLFVVYISQCIAAAPDNCAVFVVSGSLKGRVLRHYWKAGSAQHRVFLLNPFLPVEGAAYVENVPFILLCGPSGECDRVEFLSSSGGKDDRKAVLLNARPDIASHGKQIFVNGEVFVSLPSEASAKRTKAALRRLQEVPPKKRLSVLDGELAGRFSRESLDKRLRLYADVTPYLHAACWSLFLLLFLLTPLLVFFVGLHGIWPGLLAYMAVVYLLVVILFYRADRKLYRGERQGGAQRILTIALSPLAAIRANQSLVANLVSGFHPLTVAHRILRAEDFLEFARSELRRTEFLHGDAVLLRHCKEFLARENVDVKELLKAPNPESPRSRSFCPACLTQFVIESGACQDCGGVSLHPFAGDSVERCGSE